MTLKDIQKLELRKLINKKRDALTQAERISASQKAAVHLINSDFFIKSANIACYIARGAEINPQPIIDKIWAQKKNCYVPIVHPKKFGQMCFVKYMPHDELVLDRFAIKEPAFHEDKVIEPRELDLVILPLLAFDDKGNRLGTGGGYYDRAFNFVLTKPLSHKPFLCGLAYKLQKVDYIETKEWDVKIDAVVTEQGIIEF